MSGGIPMIETTFPIIVMRHLQGGFDSIPINYELQGNNHLAFILNNSTLLVSCTSPQETTCAGVVQCVNDNGGWTVVGWYKHGMINNCTLIGNSNSTSGHNNNSNEDIHVDNGEINYHVVEVLPTNRNFLTSETSLYQRLSGLKYHVQRIGERAY
eukprot:15365360-Ditylum_brightwellii.AAC.1